MKNLQERKKVFLSLFASLLFFSSSVYGASKEKIILDFKKEESMEKWRSINDGVMGGLSQGKGEWNKKSLVFRGNISLENNGGFSSLRTEGSKYNFQNWDGLLLKVKGDGRSYRFTLRDHRWYLGGAFAFWSDFTPQKEKWGTIYLPFKSFYATSFGQTIPLLQVHLDKITSLGFMLYDKKDGPFELEVAWIKVVKDWDPKKEEKKDTVVKTTKYVLRGLQKEIEKDGFEGLLKSAEKSLQWALKKWGASEKSSPKNSPLGEKEKPREGIHPSSHPRTLHEAKDLAKKEKKPLLLKIQAPW